MSQLINQSTNHTCQQSSQNNSLLIRHRSFILLAIFHLKQIYFCFQKWFWIFTTAKESFGTRTKEDDSSWDKGKTQMLFQHNLQAFPSLMYGCGSWGESRQSKSHKINSLNIGFIENECCRKVTHALLCIMQKYQ